MKRARTVVGWVLLLAMLGLVAACDLFNQPPTAAFVVVYNVTEDPLVVDLDASSSIDPDDDTIVEYLWTFGDDVDILTPLAYTKLVTIPVLRVKYPVQGSYDITLFVRDETGRISATGQTQTIVLPNTEVDPMP